MDSPYLYATFPARVGKHEWRCIVGNVTFPAWQGMPERIHTCTDWEFRRVGETDWQKQKHWPSYDHNKWDNGLPRSLQKIYDRYKPEIFAALGKPLPSVAQLSL